MSQSERDRLGLDTYAYRDTAGKWRAGERSKKYSRGQYVSDDYAQSVRGAVAWRNRVKGVMRNEEFAADTYAEAQEIMQEFNNYTHELEKARRRGDQEAIEHWKEQLARLRATGGS